MNEDTTKSTLRVASVLKSFSAEKYELSASEISLKANIPKPTTYRILSGLVRSGLLERNLHVRKYRIGPALYILGSIYLRTTDLLVAAEPVIQMLNNLTGEAASMSIFDRGNVILVMTKEAKHAFRLHVHIGSILPAYASAMGKALLSELPEAEVDNLFPEENLKPVTRKTIGTKTGLKHVLENIRRTGVSIDREGSYEGAEGIASIVRNATGKAVAAMAITVPLFRLNQPVRKKLAILVQMGSSLVSYRLGYQSPAYPIRDIQELQAWWQQKVSQKSSSANLRPEMVKLPR